MNKKIYRNGKDVGYFKRVVLEKLDLKRPSAELIIYGTEDRYCYRYIESYCNRSVEGLSITLYDVLSLDEEVNIHITEYVPNVSENANLEMLEVEIERGSYNGWKFIFELDVTATFI